MVDPVTTGAVTAVSVAAINAISKPAGELLVRLFGPLADELGKLPAGAVASWRQARLARVLGRAQERLDAAKVTPRPVDPKVLVPLLNHASLESDDGLAEMWAALLARAAAGENVPPVFPRILADLRPVDAQVLSLIRTRRRSVQLSALWDSIGVMKRDVRAESVVSVDLLVAAGLVSVGKLTDDGVLHADDSDPFLRITKLGERFLAAVEP